MKSCLVGYSGFVGSNLCDSYNFDYVFNSQNINDAFGLNPDLLVYSGIPAKKFLANKYPDEDFKIILNAIENIKKINPKKIVLISTIDIYSVPIKVDEVSEVKEASDAYGKNRFYLEEWVKNNYGDYLIVRLPGLYGRNIKKNFIYDLIHYIPSMLNEKKYNELISKNEFLKDYYVFQNNGFYKTIDLNLEQKQKLKEYFKSIGFSALNFTDSRGIFQFYNLKYLWGHINIALENGIKILNLATEPVSIAEIYRYIYGKNFKNEVSEQSPHYDFRTIYADLFEGKGHYIFDKAFVLEDIKKFVERECYEKDKMVDF